MSKEEDDAAAEYMLLERLLADQTRPEQKVKAPVPPFFAPSSSAPPSRDESLSGSRSRTIDYRYDPAKFGFFPRKLAYHEKAWAEEMFGPEAAKNIVSFAFSQTGRKTFLFSDGQHIQFGRPEETSEAGVIYFKSHVKPSHFLARLEYSERNGPINLNTLYTVSGSNAYAINMRKLAEHEIERRSEFVLKRVSDDHKTIKDQFDKEVKAGRVCLGTKEHDQFSHIVLSLAQILRTITSGDAAKYGTISTVYRALVPSTARPDNGTTATYGIGNQPNWIQIAVAMGVVKMPAEAPQASKGRKTPNRPQL